MNTLPPACELCATAGGQVLWTHPLLRVVLVDDALHPAFCRVIWHAHVREMSDLDPVDAHWLFAVVLATEQALRTTLPEAKINLASLGNVTPHLHWHVIARFADDPHFPAPVWAAARHGNPVTLADGWVGRLQRALVDRLAALAPPAP